MKVLGTQIEVLAESGRSRTIIVSDLHLPGVAGPVHDWFEALLESTHASASRTRLIVLGDLFDAWVSDAQLRMPVFARVVAALAATRLAGVELLVVHGNRDYLLGARFARASGARVVAGGLRLPLAGRDTLLLHGDELCLRDLAYQRAKRWLRHPVTCAVLRSVPGAVALWLAGRARRVSREVQAAGTRDRYEATAAAIDTAFAASGCDVLIHGHVHRAARTPRDGGREVIVLPAFDVDGVHLAADGERLHYRDREGRPLADFPAQHWT